MRFLTLAAFAAFALTVTSTSTWAAKGEKKNAKGEHEVEGTIVSVQAGNNGQGTIVLHVHHKKGEQGQKGKGAAGAQAGNNAAAAQAGNGAAGKGAGAQGGKGGGKGHTITIDGNTKIEVGKGQQGTFSQLKAGEHVTVHLKGKEAEKVVIHSGRGKGKGQKKAA
jgi:hypothetical protein